MTERIVLYDIPSKNHTSWSENVWKAKPLPTQARLVLNYKKIPYETKWIEYPEIGPTFKALGIPPNSPPKWSDWSVPTVQMLDGSYIMGSAAIAQKLEELYPEPSLHLDADIHEKVESAHLQMMFPNMPYFMPKIRKRILGEGSAAWFKADREKRSGMPEEQWETDDRVGEEGLAEMVELLTKYKRDEGPFILGSEPSYGDFIIAAMIDMFRCIGEEAYEKLVGYDTSLRKVYEACGAWLEKRN
ncbi:hypothetical protein V5O48_009662 [Marasmius crinis-equi]|uniref:GST N-terminal domain-containing protein n=1 Tax=Marasmius crinis-equi TaxID=585013 RepID=A0ABR3FB10_9AGAR